MKKQITVIVAGPAGSGRSTVSAEITRVLRNHGMKVDLTMDPDFRNEGEYMSKAGNVTRIAKNTEVTVTSIQTKHVPSFDPNVEKLAEAAAIKYLQLAGWYRSTDAEYKQVPAYANVLTICRMAVNSGVKMAKEAK